LKVSLEWLKEYVDIALEPEELSELLSMSGTAMDQIIRTGAGLTGDM